MWSASDLWQQLELASKLISDLRDAVDRCWNNSTSFVWTENGLDWIGTFTLSLLLKLPPRKLEPWFLPWSFFLLRLLCISITLPYSHAWNTLVMSGLVLVFATWNCWISYKNGYAGLLVLDLLPFLNSWLTVKM